MSKSRQSKHRQVKPEETERQRQQWREVAPLGPAAKRTHGCYSLLRAAGKDSPRDEQGAPTAWPIALREAYVTRFNQLMAMEHLGKPRYAPLVQLVVETEILVREGMGYLLANGLMNEDGKTHPIYRNLQGWVNSLCRLLQVAGLTPMANTRVVETGASLSELLEAHGAKVQDAEVGGDE